MPSRTCAVTLECAGNSRIFNFFRKKKGVQWELGAVGNAEWTGVPLSDLLNWAQIMDGAIKVVLQGSDQGEQSGRYTLLSRATDAAGSIQPDEHNAIYGSYAAHHTLPVDVSVSSTAPGSAHNSNNKW